MLNRANVTAILNAVEEKLNAYLAAHPHELLSKRIAEAGYMATRFCFTEKRFVKEHQYYWYIDYANDLCIAFKSKLMFHDTGLTLERMRHIYSIRDALRIIRDGLPEGQNNQEVFNNAISTARFALERGQINNTKITTDHFKQHRSFHYNHNILRQHWLRSLWNTTLTQSTAGEALDHALSALEENLKTVTFGNLPPAYSGSSSYK